MDVQWEAEFDGFLTFDVELESDVLNIDDFEHEEIQLAADCANLYNQPESIFDDFREECSMCCICWEPFFNDKQARLMFLEKKQVLIPFTLPCLHIGHICCLAKLLAMRCTQKCCGRCAAQIPEQLFGAFPSSLCHAILAHTFVESIAAKEKQLARSFLKMESAVYERFIIKEKT
jgi:hypothetical protein